MFKLDRNLEEAIKLIGTPVDGIQSEITSEDSDLLKLLQSRPDPSSLDEIISSVLSNDVFQFIKDEIPFPPSSTDPFYLSDFDERLRIPYEALLNAFHASAGNPISVNAAIGSEGTLLVIAQNGNGFDFENFIRNPRPVSRESGNGRDSMKVSRAWEVSYQKDSDSFLTIMYCKKQSKFPKIDQESRKKERLKWILSEIERESTNPDTYLLDGLRQQLAELNRTQ